MPAYMLFIRESAVRNLPELEAYGRMTRGNPRDPKLTPLVLYGAMEAVEGKAPDGLVILQFPTVEDARAWYHSPAYQAAAEHRKLAADYTALIVQGL